MRDSSGGAACCAPTPGVIIQRCVPPGRFTPAACHACVTPVFPRGKASDDPVFAGWFAMNGNGEMTGTTWVEESGFLWGPVMITNTHSVGVVRDAVIEWVVRQGRMRHDEWSLPVVAETW